MTSIGSSTTHKVTVAAAPKAAKPVAIGQATPAPKAVAKIARPITKISSSGSITPRGIGSGSGTTTPKLGSKEDTERGQAPKLEPHTLKSDSQLAAFKLQDSTEQTKIVKDLLDVVMGTQSSFTFGAPLSSNASVPPAPPGSESWSSRGVAAADVAGGIKALGAMNLKYLGILTLIKSTLQSATAASSASTTPHAATEGSLLLIRALCERLPPTTAEPFVMPLLPYILDLTSHQSGSIRDCADDTSRQMIIILNPYAYGVTINIIFNALRSSEWRTKHNALQRLTQMAKLNPLQVSTLLPLLLPRLTPILMDTKGQVSRTAATTLLSICSTNQNPDVRPTMPIVVNAIVKSSETMKAIEALMHTTFISSVDAPTLSILCPILSRGLKEKATNSKRMASVVIENMSKLVESPSAVSPFGVLLVPELKKVVDNVQFEDIRDVALSALKVLTKALGHSSVEECQEAYAQIMIDESLRFEEEEKAIQREREEEELRKKEEAEKEAKDRKQYKEAMEAARLLENIKLDMEKAKKGEEEKEKEKEKKSVKDKDGKCQGCGLKRCGKSCMFYEKK